MRPTADKLTDQTIGFKAAFLAPKYWGLWLLFGLIGLSSSLPRPLSVHLGDALGLTYRRANKKRAHIVDVNVRLAFPDLSDVAREKIARDHFRFYGRSIIDLGLTWWAPKGRLKRLMHFKNKQQYLDTIAEHNVILLLPHMVALDCAAGYSAILHPSITMMKEQKNPLVNWRLWKGRTRIKPTRVIMRKQGLRPLIRAAKNQIATYYMPDEDFGDSKLTVFAPFFGVQTSTLTTLSKMAKMANAKVVPIYPIQHEDGHYEITFDAPLEDFPSGDDAKDARRVNEIVEKCVRMAPAQYMWTLQWFRTRPDGGPSPYA